MAVEPNIDELPSELEERDNVTLTEVNEAVRAADIVLLLVDHTEFTTTRPDSADAEDRPRYAWRVGVKDAALPFLTSFRHDP
jgi:UDP-N-acetyl-D-mannosaminuronate dehydrogenase